MTDEDLLPGPLVTAGLITTLLGPPGAELAALVAGVDVSHKTGAPIVPAWLRNGRVKLASTLTRVLGSPGSSCWSTPLPPLGLRLR